MLKCENDPFGIKLLIGAFKAPMVSIVSSPSSYHSKYVNEVAWFPSILVRQFEYHLLKLSGLETDFGVHSGVCFIWQPVDMELHFRAIGFYESGAVYLEWPTNTRGVPWNFHQDQNKLVSKTLEEFYLLK